MANYGGYGYQYETSPKKLQPEYVPTKKAKKKTNVKPQNISSRQIREIIKTDHYSDYVEEEVMDYIVKNKLYF